MGAPRGNTNALRTGNSTARGGIVLAELGKRHASIYHSLKAMRKALEHHAAGPNGTVDLLTIAKINEALRWEMTARVTQRLIANTPDMPPGEVISALNTIGNATTKRNALLNKLLDGTTVAAANDPWSVLDNPPPVAPAVAAGQIDGQVGTLAVQSGDRAAAAAAGAEKENENSTGMEILEL